MGYVWRQVAARLNGDLVLTPLRCRGAAAEQIVPRYASAPPKDKNLQLDNPLYDDPEVIDPEVAQWALRNLDVALPAMMSNALYGAPSLSSVGSTVRELPERVEVVEIFSSPATSPDGEA